MPQRQASKGRRRNTRRSYVSEQAERCSGCKGEIPAGESFWRGITKEPWHKECRRTGVHPLRETKRFLHDNPVGQTCEGCDLEIRSEDAVVHLLARPWHKECFSLR